MYNEKQKQAFIDSYTNSELTKVKVTQIFAGFEPHEEKWGMDLSQQNGEELQPVVNHWNSIRGKSAELVLIILKEYVKWCARNGYKVSRGIFDVNVDSIDKVRERMVSSPLHLQTLLKKKVYKYQGKPLVYGFDDPEKETLDVTYRVFLWMAFAGMEDEDAIRVTDSDVDLGNLCINFEGHRYELYKECKVDFEKACNLTDFLYEHPNYSKRRERSEGNLIMRGVRTQTIKLGTLKPLMHKRLASDKFPTKERLSYTRIRLSGIFYRMYERERAGYPVDFSTFVAEEMARKEKIKEYTLTKTRTRQSIANIISRNYLMDYERWKCAFSI